MHLKMDQGLKINKLRATHRDGTFGALTLKSAGHCLSGIAAAVLLMACSTRAAYQHPEPPVPLQFTEAEPGGPPASPWPAAQWWQAFGSGQLDDLIGQAQRTNLDLAIAAARIEEADAQARIAGAPLLPALTGQAVATRQRIVTPTAGARFQTIYSPTLNASYELDFWAKNRALSAAGRAGALASRFNQQSVALAVVGAVASTYFSYQSLEERVQIAEGNLRSAQQILDGLMTQQKAGLVTALDVAQQQAAVAATAAVVPTLRQQRTQTRYALALLLGQLPESLRIETESLSRLKRPIVAPGLPSELLRRRPDVAAAEQSLIAANANVLAARAALFPSVDLTAGGGFQAGQLTGLIVPANRIYALTGSLMQPIFRGGALRGQLAVSRARQLELLNSYRSAVLGAFENTENALVAVRESTDHEAREVEALERAREAFDFARQRLKAGTVNVLAVLTAENALFAAEDAHAQAQDLRLQALVSLYVALGGGWSQT
jgi:outer membrane protein, multidrug efflux system